MKKKTKNPRYRKIKSKSKGRPSKKRAQKFDAKCANSEAIDKGIKMESNAVLQHSIIYGLVIVIGALLCFFDIRDNGLIFEGFGIKFAGTLVGVLIIIIGAICMQKNKPNVKINQ